VLCRHTLFSTARLGENAAVVVLCRFRAAFWGAITRGTRPTLPARSLPSAVYAGPTARNSCAESQQPWPAPVSHLISAEKSPPSSATAAPATTACASSASADTSSSNGGTWISSSCSTPAREAMSAACAAEL
jgi:hypothetical protein